MLTYAMMFLAPGNPTELILQNQLGHKPFQETLEAFRAEHNFDDPLPVRYGR